MINDLEDLQKKFNDKTLEIIQKIGENIKISYFEKITSENDSVYIYVHSDNKLASLVHLEKMMMNLEKILLCKFQQMLL